MRSRVDQNPLVSKDEHDEVIFAMFRHYLELQADNFQPHLKRS